MKPGTKVLVEGEVRSERGGFVTVVLADGTRVVFWGYGALKEANDDS
jgi:hypothetical protein